MIKYLLSIIVVFLMLSTFCFADGGSVDLQKEYGSDLTKAPFFLRFNFYNEYKKDWSESNYAERKSFILLYQKKLIEDQKKEQAEARAQAQKEKELQREKRQKEREKRDQLKKEQAEKRAEERAEADRQKAFDKTVRDQQKALRDEQNELEQERQQQQAR